MSEMENIKYLSYKKQIFLFCLKYFMNIDYIVLEMTQ